VTQRHAVRAPSSPAAHGEPTANKPVAQCPGGNSPVRTRFFGPRRRKHDRQQEQRLETQRTWPIKHHRRDPVARYPEVGEQAAAPPCCRAGRPAPPGGKLIPMKIENVRSRKHRQHGPAGRLATVASSPAGVCGRKNAKSCSRRTTTRHSCENSRNSSGVAASERNLAAPGRHAQVG